MGGTSCKGSKTTNKPVMIAILGLDNAGKTTTTLALQKNPDDNVMPTVGSSESEISYGNEKIKLIDLGGVKSFREVWRHYYADAYGFVYVLDSSEENRLDENRNVLTKLLQEEKVKGKPILILANKQDKPDALDKNRILVDLKIERLVNESQSLCRVELCTAKFMSRNGKQAKADPAIRNGFDWLIKTIHEKYSVLKDRVDKDVEERRQLLEKENRERKERVQKLREERERLEGTQEKEDDDDDRTRQGFVPINVAVKNAEQNSVETSTKSRPNYTSSNEKQKSESANNNRTSLPPIPAPRSSSYGRRLNVDKDDSDDQERPRHRSTDISSRRTDSPIRRTTPGHYEETAPVDSTDEQATVRPIPTKKKKLVGAGRNRSHGDGLPPPAPSSAASRREDFTVSKGPPVGTPRPQFNVVAPWAITSSTSQTTADQLTTITSDNESEDNDKNYRSSKVTKRIVSPHPAISNRIVQDRKDQPLGFNNQQDYYNEDRMTNGHKKSSREHKQQNILNMNDDDDEGIVDNDDDNEDIRKSQPVSKSRSRLNEENIDEKFGDNRTKRNITQQDHSTKHLTDRKSDNYNNDENVSDDDKKLPTRPRRRADPNSDDDNYSNEKDWNRLPPLRKSRAKLNDEDNEDNMINHRKVNNSSERDRLAKQRTSRNDDVDDENDNIKQQPNRWRRTNGDIDDD